MTTHTPERMDLQIEKMLRKHFGIGELSLFGSPLAQDIQKLIEKACISLIGEDEDDSDIKRSIIDEPKLVLKAYIVRGKNNLRSEQRAKLQRILKKV